MGLQNKLKKSKVYVYPESFFNIQRGFENKILVFSILIKATVFP